MRMFFVLFVCFVVLCFFYKEVKILRAAAQFR